MRITKGKITHFSQSCTCSNKPFKGSNSYQVIIQSVAHTSRPIIWFTIQPISHTHPTSLSTSSQSLTPSNLSITPSNQYLTPPTSLAALQPVSHTYQPVSHTLQSLTPTIQSPTPTNQSTMDDRSLSKADAAQLCLCKRPITYQNRDGT